MDGPSTDQIAVFLSVVDQGSFSAAARALNRAQSAVTYAIKRLEAQVGSPLFDRSEYRAALTESGRALLPNARRIADAVGAFRARARSLADGNELEISLVVDCIFPMARVRDALRAFSLAFPAVPTRLYVESYAETAQLLLDGTCAIGLLNAETTARGLELLSSRPFGLVELVPVVASSHALAQAPRPIPVEVIGEHIRLVLGNRSTAQTGRETGAYYGELWFVSDVAAKRDLLLTGVGWGIMPLHMIEDDLAAGRLVRIHPAKSDYPARSGSADGRFFVSMCGAHRAGETLGPASRWLFEHLALPGG